MENNLPESIKQRIEDEAEKPYRQREQEMKEHHRSVFKLEYVEGYADGYENAAEAILSNPEEYSLTPSSRVQQLEQALKIIAEWRLPETGKFWDEEKTRPTSYETEYGSNGAREYMKKIATNALKQ